MSSIEDNSVMDNIQTSDSSNNVSKSNKSNTNNNINNNKNNILSDPNVESSNSSEPVDSVIGYEPSISSYDAKNDDDDGIDSMSTTLKKVGTNFFSPRMKLTRKKILGQFIFVNVFMAIFCFTIVTLFYGSTYRTHDYYHKVEIVAVIQDDMLDSNITSVIPMTAALPQFIKALPGSWHIFNSTTFQEKYKVASEEINHRTVKLIYDEKYWIGFNVKPNVTQKLYDSLTDPTAPPFNSSDNFELIYESSRDATNLKSAILPIALALETLFQDFYTEQYLPSFMGNITQQDITFNPVNMAAAGKMLFSENDYRPFTDRLYLSPTQVGVIYCLLLSIFQFFIMGPIHFEAGKLMKPKNYLVYRLVAPFVIFFFVSLFFCTVSAIFQIKFTNAFGRGGFVIYWMTTWLFMMAAGGLNENIISLIYTWKPQFIGFWITSFVILNLAPTLFPFVLNNVFYRYGYAMPVYNVSSIYRVIFLDLSRHRMGRNYGVLVAWIALNTAFLPVSLKLTVKIKRAVEADAAKAAAVEAAQLAAKNEKESIQA